MDAARPVGFRERAQWTRFQRHSAMALLCAGGFFNLVDRQILTIMVEPIKQEFGVSDTQIGLLTGSAFALFYAAACIPLARLADRYPRSLIIGFSLAAWSLLTALGGFAGSFIQLAITRMGVALGEAGAGNAGYSMMSDLYPLRHRAKAVAVFAAFTSVGIGTAVILGGKLVDAIGWRGTLIAMGLPGLILALLMFAFLKEPRRGISDEFAADAAGEEYSFAEALRYLWSVRTYRYLVLLCAFGGTTGYGVLFWGPSFLIRAHGLSPGQAGLLFGSVSIVALVLGQIATGVLADFAARRDLRAYMWFAAGGCALAIPSGLLFTLWPDQGVAVLGFGLLSFFIAPHHMCAVVVGQTLSPPRMRATASMVIGLASACASMGLGPLFVGILNDLFESAMGPLGIRASLSVALGFLALASLAALAAARHLKADYARLLGEHRAP